MPLTEALVEADFAAVMASQEYLRRWSDSSWPTDDFALADNADDLRDHRIEHEERVAFTFSVLARDAHDVRVAGCIYIRSVIDAFATRDVRMTALAGVAPGAAIVRGWIRTDESTGLLDELVGATVSWLGGDEWSFSEVWWQASSLVPDQLAACERTGLIRTVAVQAPGGVTWHLRAVAAPLVVTDAT
ncbi:MAG: hypothetical protein AB7Q42_21880 [Acidimicrobiia bacterium]